MEGAEVVRRVEVSARWVHDALGAVGRPTYLWPWEFAPEVFKSVTTQSGEWLVFIPVDDRPEWTKPGSKLRVVEDIEVAAPAPEIEASFRFTFRVLVAFTA